MPAATTSAVAQPPEPPAGQAAVRVHGTAVRWLERGVLLLGASGVGKSDLALRLIEAGAVLVADDLVQLTPADGQLVARAAGAGLGLIELRGQGIFRVPALRSCTLDCYVTLAADDKAAVRLPLPSTLAVAGIARPHFRLDPRSASTTARLRVLLTAERIH